MVRTKIALIAVKLGVPVPQLMETLRYVFGFDCPYCQFYNKLLQKRHEIGEDQLIELLNQILTAKKNNDIELLNRLKKEFE